MTDEPTTDLAPDLRCYYHPERTATGQCDTCGDYLCEECVCSWEQQNLCPACHRKARPDLPISHPLLRFAGGSVIAVGLIVAALSPLLWIAISWLHTFSGFIMGLVIITWGKRIRKGDRFFVKWNIFMMLLSAAYGLVEVAGRQLLNLPLKNDLTNTLSWQGGWAIVVVLSLVNIVLLSKIVSDTRLLRNADTPSDVEKNDG